MLTQDTNLPNPRYVRPQEEECRRTLGDAAAHLERSARLLAGPEPDYTGALVSTLRVVRQSYAALLEWHGLSPREDATLDELARPAERLASILRTCQDRALLLEPLEVSLRNGAGMSVAAREGVQSSYYTARNVLVTVLGELPERVGRGMMARVHRAQAIHMAQSGCKPEPEAFERLPLRRTPVTVSRRMPGLPSRK